MPDLPFKGPPLSEGPLPAIFYFALSAEESLSTDPYNQPVQFLENKRVRVFSATLPFHGPGHDKNSAMKHWVEELVAGNNFLAPFLAEMHQTLKELINREIIDPNHLAAMGLSRGAFAAAHLASKEPRIQTLLGFAPLISLEHLHESQEHAPLIHALSLENIAETLVGKNVRFYIGNRDQRVNTASCFSFIHHLADLSWQAGLRSPPVEMIISPSIGYKGHGTSPETFEKGANWIINKLNI